MKHASALIYASLSISSLLIFALLPFLAMDPKASALLCPLSTGSIGTYQCGGCNPPRLETEDDSALYCPCPESSNTATQACQCPESSAGLQSQSDTCTCPTYCREDSSSSDDTSVSSGQPASTPNTNLQQTSPAISLSTSELQACQSVETAISTAMSRSTDRAQKQLNLFSTIAQRAETYYASSGKTFSTYDSLVGAVNSAQQATQSQINNLASQAGGGFNCTMNDAKAIATGYVSSLRSTIAALETYKTAVKNLLTGMISAEGSPRS